MAKSEMDLLTEKTIQKGGILAKLYFDMESEKKDDLQPLMADLINNRLLKTPGVLYCYGSIEEPLKLENSYTTSAIVTALVKDFKVLVGVAFMFSPAGIEVLKPEHEYVLKMHDMQSILTNLSSTSAEYAQYILSRVLTKEDYEKIKRDVHNREEIGRKLLDKARGNQQQQNQQQGSN
jgi:hypothetical protein